MNSRKILRSKIFVPNKKVTNFLIRVRKNFEFLEHTADLKFIAYGKTLDLCFENSALAMFSAIVDLDSVNIERKEDIEIEAISIETLLHDWLTELLFLFATNNIIFKNFNVSIKKNKNYKLIATTSGEEFDPKRHSIKAEVKAITYHEMLVKKKGDIWTAQVVCDV